MKSRPRRPLREQGSALLMLAAVLVLGIGWYTVSALGNIAHTQADRDARTAAALQSAKEALLAYVALQAADPTEEYPGRLPCPENPGQPGTAEEGRAAPRPGFNNCTQVGRLPWKTLGIDQLRDGEGEPLWYAVATGSWALLTSTTPTLSINPGLGNQLNFDVSPLPAPNAVAVIIAPGRPLNTVSFGTPPAGCSAVSQHASRYAVPYDPAKFLECGNQSGSYRKAGSAGWSNDRSISITATEVMDAIMGAVAERLQRQVAPAMNDWYKVESPAMWGQSFLPHASTFNNLATNPSVNDLCGDDDRREGMPPTATVASGTCDTNWFYADVSGISFTTTCTPTATEMRCSFSCLLCGLLTPRVTVAAYNIGNTFRSFDRTQVKVDVNGLLGQSGNVQNYNAGMFGSIGGAQFDVALPLLALAATVTIRIPHPVDAALADDRLRWFVVNGWDRFTYYAVPRAVTVNPGSDDCRSSDTSECITVNGMPNPTNRKRLTLALMGQRALPPNAWPGASPAAYLEAENATINDREFDANRIGPTFNDRLAACPFTLVTASGSQAICPW